MPLPSLGLVYLGKFYLFLTSFCFAAMGNGINLTDGVDGLAGGTAALAFIGMSIAVLPISSGQYEISLELIYCHVFSLEVQSLSSSCFHSLAILFSVNYLQKLLCFLQYLQFFSHLIYFARQNFLVSDL